MLRCHSPSLRLSAATAQDCCRPPLVNGQLPCRLLVQPLVDPPCWGAGPAVADPRRRLRVHRCLRLLAWCFLVWSKGDIVVLLEVADSQLGPRVPSVTKAGSRRRVRSIVTPLLWRLLMQLQPPWVPVLSAVSLAAECWANRCPPCPSYLPVSSAQRCTQLKWPGADRGHRTWLVPSHPVGVEDHLLGGGLLARTIDSTSAFS